MGLDKSGFSKGIQGIVAISTGYAQLAPELEHVSLFIRGASVVALRMFAGGAEPLSS
jgi:hypothetical protein